jgi:hypothetical protein
MEEFENLACMHMVELQLLATGSFMDVDKEADWSKQVLSGVSELLMVCSGRLSSPVPEEIPSSDAQEDRADNDIWSRNVHVVVPCDAHHARSDIEDASTAFANPLHHLAPIDIESVDVPFTIQPSAIDMAIANCNAQLALLKFEEEALGSDSSLELHSCDVGFSDPIESPVKSPVRRLPRRFRVTYPEMGMCAGDENYDIAVPRRPSGRDRRPSMWLRKTSAEIAVDIYFKASPEKQEELFPQLSAFPVGELRGSLAFHSQPRHIQESFVAAIKRENGRFKRLRRRYDMIDEQVEAAMEAAAAAAGDFDFLGVGDAQPFTFDAETYWNLTVQAEKLKQTKKRHANPAEEKKKPTKSSKKKQLKRGSAKRARCGE